MWDQVWWGDLLTRAALDFVPGQPGYQRRKVRTSDQLLPELEAFRRHASPGVTATESNSPKADSGTLSRGKGA